MLNFVYENNNILIDNDFIKNKMKQINGEFVKVYLYAMYAAQNNIKTTYSDIAAELGLLESEVIKAFDIFFEKGILKKSSQKEDIIRENKETKHASKEEMSEFCYLAEATMNKVLSTKEIDTLYWIYNNLSLSPEVILMAIEYCIGEGKKDINSVEKLCLKWDKEGILTILQAQKFLEEQYKKKSFVKRMAQRLLIDDLPEEFMINWYFDMNMPEDVIEYAFECCKNQINSVSPNYINTILKNWQKEDIKTVEDAKKHNENFRSRHKNTNQVSQDNGEYDDLANLTQG